MSQQAAILIVGADGLIGSALEAHLRSCGQAVIATTRRIPEIGTDRVFLDMTAENIDLQIPQKVDAAVLCAAVTGYDSAEHDPLSRHVNVTNTVRLARQLVDQGAFVVLLSTNAVFSGTQSSPAEASATDPVTAYGRQKAEAEAQLLSLTVSKASAGRLAIVRLTKVVSPGIQPFATWVEQLLAGKPIKPFSDLIFSPVSMTYVVTGLARLVQAREAGIHHCTGSVDMSYAEFAAELVAHLNLDLSLVEPVTSIQAGVTLPFRPAFAALGVTAIGGSFEVPESIGSVVNQWPGRIQESL